MTWAIFDEVPPCRCAICSAQRPCASVEFRRGVHAMVCSPCAEASAVAWARLLRALLKARGLERAILDTAGDGSVQAIDEETEPA